MVRLSPFSILMTFQLNSAQSDEKINVNPKTAIQCFYILKKIPRLVSFVVRHAPMQPKSVFLHFPTRIGFVPSDCAPKLYRKVPWFRIIVHSIMSSFPHAVEEISFKRLGYLNLSSHYKSALCTAFTVHN